ncbi:hypothetical protein [Sutcliffiella cohnii]|uniref:hypothetical protein n=1 Tax=Sutcliffiella cohnii TaxID=33932 RepID=UPI002E23EB1C|nr:hypothetical protein [Sutcliffiella cohnii]
MTNTNVVYIDSNGAWDLASSVTEAYKMGAKYIVETLQELNDLACIGVIVDEMIQTKEGIVKFFVDEVYDELFEEWDVVRAEYRLVS